MPAWGALVYTAFLNCCRSAQRRKPHEEDDSGSHLRLVHRMKESVKKPKKYDKKAHGRKMARAIIGQPKPKVVIPSKKDKAQKRQPKHKKPIVPK